MSALLLILGGVVMCGAAWGLVRAACGPTAIKPSEQPQPQPDHWGQL